jgi:hypothetical protein
MKTIIKKCFSSIGRVTQTTTFLFVYLAFIAVGVVLFTTPAVAPAATVTHAHATKAAKAKVVAAPVTFPKDIPVVEGQVTLSSSTPCSAKALGINSPATSGFVLNVFTGKTQMPEVAGDILEAHGYTLETPSVTGGVPYYSNGKYDVLIINIGYVGGHESSTFDGYYTEYFAFAVTPSFPKSIPVVSGPVLFVGSDAIDIPSIEKDVWLGHEHTSDHTANIAQYEADEKLINDKLLSAGYKPTGDYPGDFSNGKYEVYTFVEWQNFSFTWKADGSIISTYPLRNNDSSPLQTDVAYYVVSPAVPVTSVTVSGAAGLGSTVTGSGAVDSSPAAAPVTSSGFVAPASFGLEAPVPSDSSTPVAVAPAPVVTPVPSDTPSPAPMGHAHAESSIGVVVNPTTYTCNFNGVVISTTSTDACASEFAAEKVN